ncbi:MAG: HPr family phosphocarrier protein [Lachnospiraceae bacterium]|nr:HPr family phosphocarrier protein [Lachnospiraceae bacterium]
MKVKVNKIDKIKQVCEVCNQFVDNVYAISGNYRVNAKSILGMLSLDLSQEIELVIDSYRDSTITNFIKRVRSVL